ncbi:MAG: hypothetical protein CBC25_00050 [Pelagibacteraceae bacterium TMED65]|nr:MAG: hypothetical protein CBC25_00050 [Pelagibacteraceae bacterium TMED65]|tara:strand:+ start:6234 stop:7130 length:897 start_codon:yes stop_codon:yes gene_type:complete
MYNKSNSRIILIGGSGLIGSNLNSLLLKKKFSVIATYANNSLSGMIKFDFTKDQLQNTLKDLSKDDIFIILSAYGNPSWIAENKEKAYDLNVKHTINLINEISKIGSKIYFMSSVEIFDGTSEINYESTKPNPLNFYGKTKLQVEQYLKENIKNYHIIRTGWNVGINLKSRCVVSLTYNSLLKDGSKMAKDNSFTITHVEDLSDAISKIIFSNERKILHLCSSEIITRTKLADQIIKMSKNADKMSYREVIFSDIKYNEPRSKLNNLNSEYKEINSDLFFRGAEQTIKEKVNFLDNNL